MEALLCFSPYKSENMVLMDDLTKHVLTTKTYFFIRNTFSLWYSILCLFWSKNKIFDGTCCIHLFSQ
ncbi:hypothetical protein MANES_03G049950v8 [Manihot esculenta]|uniref:Uncharacterized protein n=1 Tax=Manihot esculenta TaxID=3983 RepID=A0ACB7HWN3_MANES|nr:hypothetical protein MANES_03G049950v8 [Manihot esculenta]